MLYNSNMLIEKISYGIDFGTTNSTFAYVDKDKVIKLPLDPDAEDPTVVRSVIYVDSSGQFLVGQPAMEAYISSIAINKETAKKTIFTGNYITVNDEKGNDKVIPEIIDVDVINGGRLLQSLKSALSNETIKEVNLFGKIYRIEEIVGIFLKELKKRADKIVKQDVTSAVIGRPVEYVGFNNELAVDRMRQACEIAGFKDVIFEYEPVGAAYDFGMSTKSFTNLLVFDFGGGTLDLSVVRFPDKKILGTVGIPIGGDHFNSEIFMSKLVNFFGGDLTWGSSQLKLPSYIFNSLKNWYEISLLKTKSFSDSIQHFRFMCSDIKSLDRLNSLVVHNLGFGVYQEIERVKKGLSINSEETFTFVTEHFTLKTIISRSEFEGTISDDLIEINYLINKMLLLANIKMSDIDTVVATGGSSLIPIVYNLLKTTFPSVEVHRSDMFTGVASGLAIIANNKFKKSIESIQEK
jgi:hypothetical chaperone protein